MIYFDNAAVVPAHPDCLTWLNEILSRTPVNQESPHAAGRATKSLLEQAGERLIQALCPKWNGGTAIFAASGSDAFNLLAQAAEWGRGRATVSAFEHPALIAAAGRAGSGLAAWTHVQSELGSFGVPVQGAVVMCDTIQSAGKLPLPDADVVTVSGHKLGVWGGAALLVNPSCRLKFDAAALRHKEYRYGRVEPVQALMLVSAAEHWTGHMTENLEKVTAVNRFLRRNLPDGVTATIPEADASPYILHFRVTGKQGAVIARMLSAKGIMVSPSSACQAEAGGPSAAMMALGFRGQAAFEGLRLSFSPFNTMPEGKQFLDVLTEILADY
ncbi:MAG: hypothetical protein PHI85_11430 [Victivallaceae bacterium]|nr:hypothetical protein [Victivallaceae bacterium]